MSTTPTDYAQIYPGDIVATTNSQMASYVASQNASLKANYLQAMANYNANIATGQPGSNKRPVPKVPASYYLLPADADGYTLCSDANDGPPVCDPIPADKSVLDVVTPTPKPNTIEVGHQINGKWFQVGPYDTFPSGMTTPPVPNADSDDLHTYEKFGAPVGAGWYLQIT